MYVACSLKLKSGPLSRQREKRYRINDWNLNKGWLNLQLPQWNPYPLDRQQFVMFQFWNRIGEAKNAGWGITDYCHRALIPYHVLGNLLLLPKNFVVWKTTGFIADKKNWVRWIHTSCFYWGILKVFEQSNVFFFAEFCVAVIIIIILASHQIEQYRPVPKSQVSESASNA